MVCDRFGDSSVAYQGVAAASASSGWRSCATSPPAACWPDLTLLLRLDPERAAKRIAAEGRAADRFEGEGMELQRRVAEGYEEVARRHPERVRVVEARAIPTRCTRR